MIITIEEGDCLRFDEVEVGKKFITFPFEKGIFKMTHLLNIKIDSEKGMSTLNGEKNSFYGYAPVILVE